MLEARNVYLSPHLDDAAFSLGSLIASQPGGTLVNVFTRSSYVAGRPLDVRGDTAEVDRISTLRAAEDVGFSERFGLVRLEIGGEEPILRGQQPFAKEAVASGVAQIKTALFDALDTTSSAGANVYCPAGIGRHADHLAVRTVAIAWYQSRNPKSALWFYEDLPYASRPRARWRGLFDLRRAVWPRRVRRASWRSGDRKLEQINAYPSQLDAPITDLRRFSPAAFWPAAPHEAAWELVQ